MDSEGTRTAHAAGTRPVELDAVIDAVARDMTDADPSGGLRARVLERIQQDRRRSAVVPRLAWAGAAAAVVLAAATAIWVVSPMRSPADTRTTVAQQQSGMPSPAAAGAGRQATQSTAPASQASASASRTAAVMPTGRAADARSAASVAVGADEDLHQVPALAEIEPLRFDAVEPDPLRIQAVEMTPFPTIEPIDFPSLDRGPSDTQSVDPKKEN
jgi:hypothetical protein